MKKRWPIIVGISFIVLSISSAAAAASFSLSSGGDVEQQFITQDSSTSISTASGWHDVPNTSFTVSVPSGQKRIAHITFTGESQCLNAGWCALRAVSSTNGVTSEMLPAANTDFAFASPGDGYSSHSMSRVLTLSGASDGLTYTVKVQAQIIGGSASSTFWLDDYLTQLEVSK